jgi:hypothetical protein
MRIQQTDRILKESRIARRHAEMHSGEHDHDHNVFSRAWHAVTALPMRLWKK